MLRRFARKILGRSPQKAPAPQPAAPPTLAEGSVARMEAGAQEIFERVSAGEPVTLLDVRNPQETARGAIDGAILIPLPELAVRWKEVADSDEIVCYCASGVRSLQAATLLRDRGVFNATSLEGGVRAWRSVGGELVPA